MIEFDEYKVKLNNIRPKLDALADSLGIEDIGRFLTQLPRVRRVEILPYHTLGAEKSAELNRVQRQFPVPDAAACETAEQTLRMLGLPVTSGRAQKKEDKK